MSTTNEFAEKAGKMTLEQAEKMGRNHALEAIDQMRDGDLYVVDSYRTNLMDSLDEAGVPAGPIAEAAFWAFDETVKRAAE